MQVMGWNGDAGTEAPQDSRVGGALADRDGRAATQEPGVLPRGERFRSVVSVADFCPSISDYDAHLTCSERELQVH